MGWLVGGGAYYHYYRYYYYCYPPTAIATATATAATDTTPNCYFLPKAQARKPDFLNPTCQPPETRCGKANHERQKLRADQLALPREP